MATVINCTERAPFGLDAHVFTAALWENEGELVYSITQNIHVRCQGNTVIQGWGSVFSSVSSSCPEGLVGRCRRRRGWGSMWWGLAEWHLLEIQSPTHCLGGGLSGGLGQTSGEWELTRGGGHCGAPAAAGTGALRALVAADRTGEPVRGPRAVEAGKAEIPVIMLAVLTAGFPLGRLADPAPRA